MATRVRKVRTRHWQPYPVRSITTRSQRRSSGCFFQRLPAELFDMILDRLSVLDISVFSMASKAIGIYIADHISTLAWRNRMIPQTFHHHYSVASKQSSTMAYYTALGLLFKRCTLLLPTKDRLKFIYSKFSQIPCFMMEKWTSAPPVCLDFSCYGVFLQTLTAGWDELECQRVFNFLCDFTNLPQKIEIVVTGKPGANRYLEMQIRLFCREILLDQWPNPRDSLFWLTCILKPWPIVSQARLLFILYGPLLPDSSLAWQEVLRATLPRRALLDLANTMRQLHSNVKEWSSWLTILEELTVLPEAWHSENVARLLVMSGDGLCCSMLVSKALNGRLSELSRLIVYAVLVCEKDGYCTRWAVEIVQQVSQVLPTTAEKWSFIQNLEDTFSVITMEAYANAMAGNHLEEMDFFQSLSSLLSASAHFHTEILNIFLNEEKSGGRRGDWFG